MKVPTRLSASDIERARGGALVAGSIKLTHRGQASRLDFARVNAAALNALPALLRRWLPDGHREGREWVALNPQRNDHRCGSFKINLATGKWSDFATGDRGSDVVSLAAYLANLSQFDAARQLADMLGLRNE
jgi:hypothetical protein